MRCMTATSPSRFAATRAALRSWRKRTARPPGGPASASSPAGPGATNAAAGIHIARQDSTPLILFVGQIARDMREREAFQELDYRAVFGSIDEMGDRDRRSRPHPRAGLARLLCRDQRPARPGGDGAARGHAGRARRGGRRAAVRAGRDLARRRRHEPAAEAAVGGRAADHAARRQPLVGGGLRRGGALRRALRAAGRDHVPARAPVRSGASQLRRRSRHRAQSQAAGAGQGRRSSSCWWGDGSARCPRRATRCSTFRRRGRRWCMSIPASRSSAASTGRSLPINAAPTAFAAALEGLRAAEAKCAGAARRRAAHAEFLAWTDTADGRARCGQSRRDHRRPARQASRRCRDLQRRRQFLGLGASLSPLPALRHASSRRSPAPWATACRRRSP